MMVWWVTIWLATPMIGQYLTELGVRWLWEQLFEKKKMMESYCDNKSMIKTA